MGALIALLALSARGQAVSHEDRSGGTPRAQRIQIDWNEVPKRAMRPIDPISVQGADLQTLLRAIGRQYDINLLVDADIDQNVTVRLNALPAIRAVATLADEYGLSVEHKGEIFRIRAAPAPAPEKPPLSVHASGGRLSLDAQGVHPARLAKTLTELSDYNVTLRGAAARPVSGYVEDAAFEEGLRTVLANSGLALRKEGEIYVIYERQAPTSASGSPGSVRMEKDGLSLSLRGVPLKQALEQLASETGVHLITRQVPQAQVSVRAQGLTTAEAFEYLLDGSDATFRKEGGVYFVGSRRAAQMQTVRLIKLDHVRAEGITKELPPSLTQEATVRMVKEQNGILVSGPHGVVEAIASYVDALDKRPPQILIEALVVDFEETALQETGVSFGLLGLGDSLAAPRSYRFGRGSEGVRGVTRGSELRDDINWWTGKLGISPIGQLPEDFYVRIRALEQDGKADVLSRPQIATLNGHPANISVGTTQYYILKNATAGGRGEYYPVESERFEKIEARVKLEVVPWVSASGEIIAEIKPEFSTPVGRLDPGVPPTINSRVLDATVRLKDGETIILGGLIQESVRMVENKVPILGDIPLLGRLFSNREQKKEKSELVIYLTPHVFYGDGSDARRWDALREEFEFTDPTAPDSLGYTQFE